MFESVPLADGGDGTSEFVVEFVDGVDIGCRGAHTAVGDIGAADHDDAASQTASRSRLTSRVRNSRSKSCHDSRRRTAPVAGLDALVEPRVFVQDGFNIAMWTYFEPVPARVVPPTGYAQALERLHVGLHKIDLAVPHVMDRVSAMRRDVASRDFPSRSR